KSTFFTARLGATGAKYMSSSLLYFIAGIASIYAMIVVKDKKQVKLTAIAKTFGENLKSIVPTIAICLFGYMFGSLFTDLDVATGLEAGLNAMSLGKLGLCIIVPLITCILGIAIVGSSMVVVFGPILVTIFAAAGVDPLLTAAMLPCICGVMSNMVPPIAPAFLAAFSLSGGDFGKAVKNDMRCIIGQYVHEVIVLLGWLPILGL
ncbi:MAG: TRAP transporter large permease subunit, partial [Lachnospiraceae bacterium]|nr:TRAP transporter large permease subunit [Lachnospiraceae bacterium]